MTIAKGIAVRDTILWVTDTGEKHLPAIVCLHSLWLDGSMFDALAAAAAGRFRIIRPDFRGQGSSAPATEGVVSMECCADDINALIDLLGAAPVSIAAASMGGDVAVRMIARRPELFNALVMLGSSVRGEPPEQLARFREFLDGAKQTGFVGPALDMLMAIMFGATTRGRAEAKPMLEHWSKMLESTPISRWPALIGVLERSSAVPLLSAVKIPTLVFSGEEDIARPREWSKEVVDGVNGAQLVPLEVVGHTPILEAPDIVVPRTLEFIAAAVASGSRQIA